MLEKWTCLCAEMSKDGTIVIERASHYEWDEDKEDDVMVYEHTDVRFDPFDLYAAIMNSMIDTYEWGDDEQVWNGYGMYPFIAWNHHGQWGYYVDNCDAHKLDDSNKVEIKPLSGDWEEDVREAYERFYGEE